MSSNGWRIFLTVTICGWFCGMGTAIGQAPLPQDPVVAAASDEAVTALSTFQLQPLLQGQLVAAEPDVANVVAFTVDDLGRIFVCETFRQEEGVTDNRSHDENWVDRDLQAMTVEDRIRYHQELLAEKGNEYTRQDDRIRLLLDHDHDGRMDQSLVFANHFNQLEDGTGAGVLAVNGQIWYTNIPHLWALTDANQDGVADQRTSLQSGFGVRVAFRGHDMHGLVRGPDGRIYFSIGDRGYHLETSDGRTLADPASGAVFRCFPDGSRMEVFATGLRNPQELVFDNFGNLFTGDNNSDSGDRARWVYVLPGSDSGWRMNYQYLPDRGPFNREKIWHPFHQAQPAYIVPPIVNFGDGPSGVCFYPGTGFAEGFNDHFFMCDFRGSSSDSGIRSFQLKPLGAFFEMTRPGQPIWRILATDAMFGPDGYLYASDWVDGWVGEGKGRIYRFADPNVIQSPMVSEVRSILQMPSDTLENSRLRELLGHVDQRVRFKAQFELVDRVDFDSLLNAATEGHEVLERLHGIWGIECLALTGKLSALEPVIEKLARDQEPQIRAQAARIIGELGTQSLIPQLIQLVNDESPRVQMLASWALGKFESTPEACDALLNRLEQNRNLDPAVRHGAIMGLISVPSKRLVEMTKDHFSEAVRRAAVVALRRQKSPEVVAFLDDPSDRVANDAASAIYDLPITEGITHLAQVACVRPDAPEFTRRAIAACFRSGTESDAERLCQLALDQRFSLELRKLALQTVSEWGTAKNRDPVIGTWWPNERADPSEAAIVLSNHFLQLIRLDEQELKSLTIVATEKLVPNGVEESIAQFVTSDQQSLGLRIVALRALAKLNPAQGLELARTLSKDGQPGLRAESRKILAQSVPVEAIQSLSTGIDSSDLRERQESYRTLRALTGDGVSAIFKKAMVRLNAGEILDDTRLDVVMSAKALAAQDTDLQKLVEDYQAELLTRPVIVDRFRDSLFGGDPEAGRKLFYEKTQLSCLRCHRIGEDGGNVGPNLTDIAKTKDRQYLMASIVDPNDKIAEKFGTVVVLDEDGKTSSGIVHQEDDNLLRLLTAEGNMLTIAQSSIVERREGKSAMPEDLIRKLSPDELRDLVEFLCQLTGERKPDVESLELK